MSEVDAGINDRTSRFLSLFLPSTVEGRYFPFQSLKVHLGIAPDWARTSTGQTLVLTAANLLGRFVGRVDLDVPAVAVVSPLGTGRSDLFGEAELMAHMARARLGEPAQAEPDPDVILTVQVGEGDARGGFRVRVSAHGWKAELGSSHARPPVGSEDSNPFGALVAASIASAEVFKEILRSAGSVQRSVRSPLGTFSFSALDFSTDPAHDVEPIPSTDGLTTTLVGAGAVANSLAFALGAVTTRHSTVRVVDPDRLDESNLNRHLLSNRQDVGRPKAEIVADFLRIHGFSATTSVAKYQDIRTVLTKDEMQLVVSTVDNDEARLALQSDLPRLLFHGATDGDEAVVSRHSFIEGACLGCLFYEQTRSYAESVADDTGLPLDEVVRLLEAHGVLTERHVDVIIRQNGPQFDRLRLEIGRSFEEVYATQICGVMNVSIGEQHLSPTVSFVSALPGFLLAAELLKSISPKLERYQLRNYLALSLFAPSSRQVLYRPKDQRCRCFCADPIMRSSYHRRWGSAH